ncbi:hypothetical protein [Metabacillus schmidteae]|uniref:hypothetical protein n=1 Tax=Metabacillus schmidteae TaxID=2730405 RepID=UPI00115A5310|nr:hypothetical protein [Metabacillus schmidteae]
MLKNLLPITIIFCLSLSVWLLLPQTFHEDYPAIEVFGKLGTCISLLILVLLSVIQLFYYTSKK